MRAMVLDSARTPLRLAVADVPQPAAWLTARPRWHLHFVPTYSSWLNLVERFFALITDKAIRRGSFRSVRELVQRIDHFVAHHNVD